MKKNVLKRSVAIRVVAGILVFFTQAYGADSIISNARNKSETQGRHTRKMPARQINKNAVSPSSFTPEMPFSEAVNILRNTTIPPLNIVVLWKNIEQNADIYKDTPIGIDGASGVPLRAHLKLLLMSLSAGSSEKLGYVVDDGVIIISTESSLPKRLSTRIYDITDLVGVPANGSFFPGAGMPFGFGGMMSFGLGGLLGGIGNAGYAGQGQQSYRNVGIR